jgi:hypothetical protein
MPVAVKKIRRNQEKVARNKEQQDYTVAKKHNKVYIYHRIDLSVWVVNTRNFADIIRDCVAEAAVGVGIYIAI